MYTVGKIVKSLRGNDKGRFFVLVGADEKFVYIADGKKRKLANPKKKNIKHIIFTDNEEVNLSEYTDKSLRKLINRISKQSMQ